MQPILLIDDDATVLSGLQQLLALEQITTATATDASSADKLISSQFFPVILADLRLRSERDGLELIGRVRRISPDSKVAAMSGFLTPEIEALAALAGAAAVLRKPFDSDDLLATIRALLDSLPVASDDYEAIYCATAPRLRAMIARRYRLRHHESDDVLQQAWCVLLERRAQVRDVGAFLAGTVINLSRQTIQRKQREIELECAPEQSSVGGAEIAGLSVRSAISRLDQRSRQLCTMIGLEQMDYAEVSERLSIPLGSVGPLYMRARQRLRRELTN